MEITRDIDPSVIKDVSVVGNDLMISIKYTEGEDVIAYNDTLIPIQDVLSLLKKEGII